MGYVYPFRVTSDHSFHSIDLKFVQHLQIIHGLNYPILVVEGVGFNLPIPPPDLYGKG